MSALETLKQILEKDKDNEIQLADDGNVQSLNNLQNYIVHKKKESNNLSQLLELVRIESSNEEANTSSQISSLSVSDLHKLIARFQKYQTNIKTHREKLMPIKTIITDFNTELEQLSSSLASLQQQSSRLSSDLDLQRASSEKLNPIILDLMIPPDIVKSIVKDLIDVQWLENIRFINEKILLISSVKSNKADKKLTELYKDSRAFSQLESGIKLLVAKSVERIRDFIIYNIKLLRSSQNTSSQSIQQSLLNVKELFAFIKVHHSELANQLQLAYIYTMKWYYQTRFAKYLYAIEKLHIRHVDLNLVLGSGHNANDEKSLFGGGLKNWLYSGGNNPMGSSQTNTHLQLQSQAQQLQQSQLSKLSISDYLLSIDKRLQILEARGDTPEPQLAIPSQIAETTPFNYWLEFIYNQWSIALIDNIVVEYLFMVEFFYQGDEKFCNVDTLKRNSRENDSTSTGNSQKNDWSHVMFSNVYKMGYDFVSWLISHQPSPYLTGRNNASITTSSNPQRMNTGSKASLQGTCDGYAVLLMIRLVQKAQSLLHNEFHIPVLDDHLNSVLLLLWPHFTKIIDLNSESMKKLIMYSGSSKSKEVHLAPVSVTQQFSQFLLGLLKLAAVTTDKKDDNDDTFRGEPLFTSITRLRNDFENVLTKLSSHLFGSGRSKSTEKEIFLYNNYFLVVNILKNENLADGVPNAFIDEQIKHFEMLCDAYKKY
ncbi:uncharacterized protein AC631_03608 [Debaryomyces fabryi]|uniref:Vacuolar protein sorting-associated protein 52 n=1 Tax=Debaryomyces fabryi TaxID=58627 RepID=A0A0V1PWF5_9ASCO|nr:uncharacterized protein AC631_03608 [Debaryomyces fabryi]KSA00617.1 hypothetical protein AC631_03608 [Debaryomyces fabryi]CUM51744.1 unnamed protein product [Debaryomyces fabryi]